MNNRGEEHICSPYNQQILCQKLQPIIDRHKIIVDTEKLIIPGEGMDCTGSYNYGTVFFADIASITISPSFVNIKLSNGYLYSLSMTDEIRTCLCTHQHKQNMADEKVTPGEIASNINDELAATLEDMRAKE